MDIVLRDSPFLSAKPVPGAGAGEFVFKPKEINLPPMWPPISWQDFSPRTYPAIERHYFAYSSGCFFSWWETAVKIWVGVVLALVGCLVPGLHAAIPAAIAGASAAVAATAGAAAAGVVGDQIGKLVADRIKKEMSDFIKNGFSAAEKDLKDKALRKGRKIVGGNEMDRIRDSYWKTYQGPQGLDAAAAQWIKEPYLVLKAKLQANETILKQYQDDCKACDKSGQAKVNCRCTGVQTLVVQYLSILVGAYEATNTNTPDEYNAYIKRLVVKSLSDPAGMRQAIESFPKDKFVYIDSVKQYGQKEQAKKALIGAGLVGALIF